MTTFPEPLAAPDCDLREFRYMPLYGERLFSSETWIKASAEAKVAALRLWWRAWHEVPAGSLPDDDMMLSEFAGYGVAVSAWKRIKTAAMRGWIKCSDGRLYHPVVCQIAMDAYAEKQRHSERKAKDRDRKSKTTPTENGGHSDGKQNHSDGIPPEIPLKGEGEGKGDGKVRDKEGREDSSGGDPAPVVATRIPPDWSPGPEGEAFAREKGFEPDRIDEIAQQFRDYWTAKPGAAAKKLDWPATWRVWIAKEADNVRQQGGSARGRGGQHGGGGAGGTAAEARRDRQRAGALASIGR